MRDIEISRVYTNKQINSLSKQKVYYYPHIFSLVTPGTNYKHSPISTTAALIAAFSRFVYCSFYDNCSPFKLRQEKVCIYTIYNEQDARIK